MTVSHLRFSDRPIRSTYLVQEAGFVACHHLPLLDRVDVLGVAAPGATVLLNSPWGADGTWDRLPVEVQEQVVAKGLVLWAIDADALAREVGLAGRRNAVLLPCFFALSEVLPRDQAMAEIKRSFARAYGSRGGAIVERNEVAIDRALAELRPGPGPTTSPPPAGGGRCPTTPPTWCSGSRPACWPARATCCRSAPCPWTARGRPGRPATSSGAWPPSCRCGMPTCASTAAAARSCARTPPSA